MRDLPREAVWDMIHDMEMNECTAMAKQAGLKCVFEGEYGGFPVCVCDECVDALCDWVYTDDEPLVCHCDDPKEAAMIANKGKLKQDEHKVGFEEVADLFEEAVKEYGYGSLQCETQIMRMMEIAGILPDKESSLIPIELGGFDGFEFSVMDRKIFYKGASVNAHDLVKLLLHLFSENYLYSKEQRADTIKTLLPSYWFDSK